MPHAGEPYSGLLQRGVLYLCNSANAFAHREGLELVTITGERLRMEQIRRPPERFQFDDHCAYRAHRDLVAWMEDTGHRSLDPKRAVMIAAPFDPCPSCNDRYGYADACEECDGWGFVPEVR